MRAVDTNVLVRLITRDDPRQVAVAEAFVAKCAWVPYLAIAEATRPPGSPTLACAALKQVATFGYGRDGSALPGSAGAIRGTLPG